MRLLFIEEMEVHLKGSQAFIYAQASSEVLNIEDLESKEDDKVQELILRELEFLNRSSLCSASFF